MDKNTQPTNKQSLVICGPTAAGKTSLALRLAKTFNTQIISADSRQVYKGMDIGTGKDIPKNFRSKIITIDAQEYRVYSNGHISIFGYDLALPNQRYNVADYVKDTRPIIHHLIRSNSPPIIAGGTGFYIKSLIDPPDTLLIKRNPQLRAQLSQLSVSQLQSKLANSDPTKVKSMNHSDFHNPRRLIRAIEVAKAGNKPSKVKPIEAVMIGLRLDSHELENRIKDRVRSRLKAGMLDEVKRLKLKSLDSKAPAKTSIGYAEIQKYLDGKISLNEATKRWETQELQYAKRQLTWFSKQPNIKWFDVASPNLATNIVEHLNT